MNTMIKPSFTAVWSTDAQGICITSQASPAGMMPELKGVTLSSWLRLAQADDDAKVAQKLTAALEELTPFHIEVPIIENSTDLIAHCDAEGRYVSISPSYSEMIGWTAEEVVGRLVLDFLHPDDHDAATETLSCIFSGGVWPDVVEVRKLHRDGHYINLGTKACGVTNPNTGKNIGAVLVSRDITRDKERMRDLEKLATLDTLTGLHNRAWIIEKVGGMLSQVEDQAYTTVMFIDLNGFKAVNDLMGHATGDALLQQVSQRLQRCMRPGDSVARLGGDEFALLMSLSWQRSVIIAKPHLLLLSVLLTVCRRHLLSIIWMCASAQRSVSVLPASVRYRPKCYSKMRIRRCIRPKHGVMVLTSFLSQQRLSQSVSWRGTLSEFSISLAPANNHHTVSSQ